MFFELLAALLAGLPVVGAAALVLIEARPSDAANPQPVVLPEPSRPPRLCITAPQARCACGHARQRHETLTGDECGCASFKYAGGLIDEVRELEDATPAASQRPRPARASA